MGCLTGILKGVVIGKVIEWFLGRRNKSDNV